MHDAKHNEKIQKERAYYDEVLSILKEKKLDKDKLSKVKLKLCKKHKLAKPPTDIAILLNTPIKDIESVQKHLITKPTRSISGVAVVAIMTKPYKCPHGKCDYCPGGPASHFGDVPQSYTGEEPATLRAQRNDYDPYLQVFNRLEQYIVTGHVPDKVELIIMGGTFPSVSKVYQKNFVINSFKAMNDFSKLFFKNNALNLKKFREFFELPGEVDDPKRAKHIKAKLKLLKARKTTLEKEHKTNETAKIKCVGLTIETRPDYGRLDHGNFALELGATRLELGIESVSDKILEQVNRGHTIEDSTNSIQELKDIGFKLNFHYMPGLPGVSTKDDLKFMKQLFTDERFQPDMLKLYPAMVMKGTNTYKSWKKGKFKPLSTEQAGKLIAEFKRHVPTYCRIMRIQRDIPTKQTEDGVDRTNLRQYVEQLMKQKGTKCRCIRCREVGRAKYIDKIEITVIEYPASGGKEFFIAAEDKKHDVILGFTRLRLPSTSLRKEITKDSALLRELHVYGTTAALNEKTEGASAKTQHKGYGKKLLQTAEKIAKQHGKNKLLVISGVGVREYYKKHGYKKQGPYMVKKLY